MLLLAFSLFRHMMPFFAADAADAFMILSMMFRADALLIIFFFFRRY